MNISLQISKTVNKDTLINLLRFAEFTNLFAGVYRKTILNKDGSPENNAQHSFQMAMVAWYISLQGELALDIDKIIRYALVHDLVETYSGTSPVYSRTAETQAQKDDAEESSLNRFRSEFANFPDLITYLDEYILLQNHESKFIYALDKLLPLINIELNNHDFYQQTKTTYEDMLQVKDAKIATDPTIYAYFELLKKYLKDERKFFWPDNQHRDYNLKNYSF